jgi:hypothetical protein
LSSTSSSFNLLTVSIIFWNNRLRGGSEALIGAETDVGDVHGVGECEWVEWKGRLEKYGVTGEEVNGYATGGVQKWKHQMLLRINFSVTNNVNQ